MHALQASARCHWQPTRSDLRDRVLPRGMAVSVRQPVLHALKLHPHIQCGNAATHIRRLIQHRLLLILLIFHCTILFSRLRSLLVIQSSLWVHLDMKRAMNKIHRHRIGDMQPECSDSKHTISGRVRKACLFLLLFVSILCWVVVVVLLKKRA